MKLTNRMETGMKTIRKFFRDSKGATAIEYGLIAALIAVAAIAAMQGLGNQLSDTFGQVNEKMGEGNGKGKAD